MEVIALKSWDDYPAAIASVYARVERGPPGGIAPQPLFRGQTEASWDLITSLERYPDTPRTFHGYWKSMNHVAFPIAAYTGANWAPSTEESYREWLHAPMADTHFMNLPWYAFMVHLRHHGFPSPLLDWTRSPWIAAYFAFRDVQSRATSVAVFAYLDSVTGARLGVGGQPQIFPMGPFVGTHRRHFLQQCAYTVCATRINPADWLFARHTAVVGDPKAGQDLLWKFELPATERNKVLANLDDYNIGAYSLFSSEESLMESLAARHFFLGKRI